MIERILIVGYGSIGSRHLRIVRKSLPYSDIRILRHRQGVKFIEGANGCFDKLEDALAFQPQIAIIANPAPFHLSVAIALVHIGCHILVEKPLASELNEISKLVSYIKGQNCIFQVGYNLRFLTSLNKFRARIVSGEIGRILSVHCEVGQYLPSWRPHIDYRETVSAHRNLGGGVLLELSHELDYLRWIFGDIAWVNARLTKQSSLEIDVEDTASLILGFLTLDKNPIIATLNMDFIRQDAVRLCTVIGEFGTLRWDGKSGEIKEFSAKSSSWVQVFSHSEQRDDSYQMQWEHFLRCINLNLQPLVGIDDGIAVLEIIEAARKSSKEMGVQVTVSRSIANDGVSL